MNTLLLSGLVLLAVGLFRFIHGAIDPDGSESVGAILLFGTPLFPAMMGLVLIVAGFAAGLLSRMSWDTPQLV